MLKGKYIDFPIFNQEKNYTCGCACVRAFLEFNGEDPMTEQEIVEELDANVSVGTLYRNIANFFHDEGYQVFFKQNLELKELTELLDNKQPVLIALQAWSEVKDKDYNDIWNSGHYLVVIGYDDNNIYFMDPSTVNHYGYIPISEFKKRWHDIDGDDEPIEQFAMVIIGKLNGKIKPINKEDFKKIK